MYLKVAAFALAGYAELLALCAFLSAVIQWLYAAT